MARKRIVRMGKVYWYDTDEKPVATKIEDVKVSAKVEKADGSEKEITLEPAKTEDEAPKKTNTRKPKKVDE